MTENQRAVATDTACLSMTSMFLAKMVDSGMLEHLRRRDEAEASWAQYTRRLPNGQKVICLGHNLTRC